MKLFSVLLAICFALTAGTACASCLFDVDRFAEFVLDGKDDQAKGLVAAAGSRSDCGCDTPDTPCLRLGPKGADVFSINSVLAGLKSFRQWERSVRGSCMNMPQDSQESRLEKLACLDARTKEHQNKIEPGNLPVFGSIANRAALKMALPIRELLNKKQQSQQNAKDDFYLKRNRDRTEALARQLCELWEQREELQKQIKVVRRQMKLNSSTDARHPIQLEYRLKALTSRIDGLKKEFEAVTDEPFLRFMHCTDN